MTENLAGRGEGLAGLVAEWRKEGDASKGVGRRIHHQFADKLEAEIAALEAAAPPSTAGVGDWVVIHARVVGIDPYLRVVVEGTEPNTPSALVMKPGFVRALATPSPQAPATTPVDEPKNDDRAYGCYTCGKQGLKKGQRVSLVYCNECDAKHIEEVRRAAATQEQPAGSADSRSVQRRVALQKGYSMPEFSSDPGSPRKVGEDGASERVMRVALLAIINMAHRAWEDKASVETMFRLIGKRAKGALELARPSSVPVGEQKQEEGV